MSASLMLSKTQVCAKAFSSGSSVRTVRPNVCVRATSAAESTSSRRQLLELGGALAAASILVPGSAQAKGLKGFQPVQDLQDNYQFVYPFGWQEVSIKGADVVYKDVVEPLESVSVTLTSTDKKDISEFGEVAEVSDTLARSVLTGPGQDVKLIKTAQRTDPKGRNYYELEFTADTGRYIRHQVAVVTVDKGTFYTLTTGANERRWGKIKDKLLQVVNSFSLIN